MPPSSVKSRTEQSEIESLLKSATKNLDKRRALLDFRFSVNRLFEPDKEFEDFHFSWCGYNYNPTSGLYEVGFFETGLYNLLLGCPGSAKSTIAHICRHAWLILRHRELYLLGIDRYPKVFLSGSATLELATGFTRAIKRLLLKPEVVDVFGDIVVNGERAADSHFRITGIQYGTEKEDTVEAFGMLKGTIAAKHADEITIDDAVNRKNSESPTDQRTLIEKHDFDVTRAMNPATRLNVIGNCHHPADYYANLQDAEKRPAFKGRLIKVKRLGGDSPETFKSFWPKRWSLDSVLFLKENTGPIIWEALHQQNVKPMRGGIINWDWFKWQSNVPGVEPENLPRYIGIDSQIKQEEHNDYFAATVWSFDRETRRRFEKESYFGKLTFEEKISKIISLAANHYPFVAGIAIEEQGGGFDLASKLSRETGLKIVSVPAMRDFIARLIAKQHLFSQGLLWFIGPERPGDFMKDVGIWPEELVTFRADVKPPPPAHKDRTAAWLIMEDIIPDFGPVNAEGSGTRQMETAMERESSQIGRNF